MTEWLRTLTCLGNNWVGKKIRGPSEFPGSIIHWFCNLMRSFSPLIFVYNASSAGIYFSFFPLEILYSSILFLALQFELVCFVLCSFVHSDTANICWVSPAYQALHREIIAVLVYLSEEPGRLQSMGSLRVRHNWMTSLSLFTFMHWRRKWQPTPVFLSGESQRWRSLVGCRLWGRTESDTTGAT